MPSQEPKNSGLSVPEFLDSPFLHEDLFADEVEPEPEQRLTALQNENPFQRGLDQPQAVSGVDTDAERPLADQVAFEEAGIIDVDNRVLVKNTTGLPWRWICKIRLTDNRGVEHPAGGGTGVLVSDRHVLTAAHVVYEAFKNMHQYTVTVIPALDGNDEPFDSYSISAKPKIRKEYSPGASDSRERQIGLLDWDYALLTLSKAVGKKSFSALKGGNLCYWGSSKCGANTFFGRPDPRTLNGKAAYTAGYPGKKGGKRLWCAAGILHSADQQRRTMRITADVTKGQSGSPVWVIDRKRCCLVGLAVATREGAASNTVVRVTRELIRQVREWISADGDTPTMTEDKELLETTGFELSVAAQATPDGEPDVLRSPERFEENTQAIEEPEEPYRYEDPGRAELLEPQDVEYDLPADLPPGLIDALKTKQWPRALKLAIQAGLRDEAELTNLLFFERHRELGGRKLDPARNKEDKTLSDEWGRILKHDVRPAIRKASEDDDLKVSGDYVTERDPQFSGASGKTFKELVAWAAREVDINPGLLAAVLLAEEDKRSVYLTSGAVSSFRIGVDDFFAQRTQLGANVPAFSKVRFDENKRSISINEHGREVVTVPFRSGKDAALATAVYLKNAEIKLRKGAQKNGGDFDKLPVQTRFALNRIAMTAGHGGIGPDGELIKFKKKAGKWVPIKQGEKGGLLRGVAQRLDRVLRGEDILIRQHEPRKDPTKDPHVTNRNATILVAQAMHLSDWIFGIPLAPGVQREVKDMDDAEKRFEGLHDIDSYLEEHTDADEVEDAELDQEIDFINSEEYEDENKLFEELVPKPVQHSILGEVSVAKRAQRCEQLEQAARSYPEILAAIECELQIPFRDPNDPGLYQRRQRLRNFFKKIPPRHVKMLYSQLQQKNDAFGQLFRYRLSTPTREELIRILKTIPSPIQPAPQQPTTRVWLTEPLPSSEFHRFRKAIVDLEIKVKASTTQDPRRRRYLCWIEKLKSPVVDDRIIGWSKICPRTSGAIGAAFVLGPCDLTQGTPVDQSALERSIRSVRDVEVANESLRFITHMRSAIVVSFEMTSLQLESLRRKTDDAGRAIEKLDEWANAPMGGSSAMPLAYRGIKDWIIKRQNDPTSLYSCF